jgi:hypothetical protein
MSSSSRFLRATAEFGFEGVLVGVDEECDESAAVDCVDEFSRVTNCSGAFSVADFRSRRQFSASDLIASISYACL